ncbi:hypothetical protein FGG08_003315 [Glutinoglossum americanum]|uniref:20S-pre-rRNA D-site endonuclease NOB1 n=1 Tax=Glutinoglossum americanum TaxID=1670608 RepID=A0A9P8I7G9_9PEZI|nr:hypothetical protein FGG08_003315 [Glutinoglossum americanum]
MSPEQGFDQARGTASKRPMGPARPMHTIVLDAGPILKNEPTTSSLLASSVVLVTVPSVITEIRDSNTRSRIETTLLPFLTLRNPKPESLSIVTEFARRTGDHAVLSRVDLLVLALAYELECERNGGDWRLRRAPGQRGLNGAPPTKLGTDDGFESVPVVDHAAADDGGHFDSPTKPNDAVGERGEHCHALWGATGASKDEGQPSGALGSITMDAHKFESLTISRESQALPPDPSSSSVIQGSPTPEQTECLDPDGATLAKEPAESEESDSEGWITPSNIQKHKAMDLNKSALPAKEVKTMQVSTITTDFAMQNVLLQMNLNLLSPSMQRIRHLKIWVLRCHACFKISRDMSKQFCPSCGGATLTRTACSTDQNGLFKVHLKKNYQWNNRGNIFSIPKPVSGSSSGKVNVGGGGKGGGKGGWGQGLILREDQKEYVQAMQLDKKKKERDPMDEDYLPNILTGERGRAGGRPAIGAGRNVNSKKRR